MNMPAPMNVKAFNEMQLKIADAYLKVSKTSMTDAAEEIRQDNIQEGDSEDSVANITVSCDGTWQKGAFIIEWSCDSYCSRHRKMS